eukprot:sb/3471516/
MPCQTQDISETQIIDRIGETVEQAAGDSDHDSWSEESVEDQGGYYTQLDANHVENTEVFSDDEEEGDQPTVIDHPQNGTHPVENDDEASTDEYIRRVLADPDPDLGCPGSMGFPEISPLTLNMNPSVGDETQRRQRLDMSVGDQDFIRSSMASMNITPPPWAAALEETDWKAELRKRLEDGS